MPSIDLSRIPVNKGIKSRLSWTNYSDLYKIVHPSLGLISSCLLTGEKYGKGLFALSYKTECNHLQTRTRLYEEAISKRREPTNAILYPN